MPQPGEDPAPGDVWPGFAVSCAVESYTVLPLDCGHTVHPAQAGRAEHGEGDGLLQPLPRSVHQAPVLPVLRQTEGSVGNNPEQYRAPARSLVNSILRILSVSDNNY